MCCFKLPYILKLSSYSSNYVAVVKVLYTLHLLMAYTAATVFLPPLVLSILESLQVSVIPYHLPV